LTYIRFILQDRKKELQKKQAEDHALLKKTGLDINLVNEHEDDIKLAKLLTHKKGVYSALKQTKMHIFLLHIYAFTNAFFLGARKQDGVELKRLVSIIRSKNKKKISSSNDRLKLQSQESPKTQEITNNATISKINSSSISLVNYDSSNTDSDT